ncbi:hypothetical protein HHI36_021023 [Cryptolaemus montrouzieri]|uniref:SIAH-type domain-containing protein n=1 Tax=Cryptolaemus montrouzieri TaxID=559131 RepID=A0ABD2MVH0_9CUCU
MSNEEDDFEKYAFADVVTCHRCRACIFPPYYRCYYDHKHCKKCTEDLPACSCNFVIKMYDNLEKAHPEYSMMCPNSLIGCGYRGTPQQCNEHDEICAFRPVFCPLTTKEAPCEWDGETPSYVAEHFNTSHPDAVRWNRPEDADQPKRGTIDKFRQLYSKPIEKDVECVKVVFPAHGEMFFLKIVLTTAQKLKCSVEHLAMRKDREEMNFKYQVLFGTCRKGMGNNCGVDSQVSLNDVLNVCQLCGDLIYEVEIFDKETHMDGANFEFNIEFK